MIRENQRLQPPTDDELRDILLAPRAIASFPTLFLDTQEVWKPIMRQLLRDVYQSKDPFNQVTLDTKIIPTVIGLRLHKFPTIMSCEGHRNEPYSPARSSSPYIELKYTAPDIQYLGENAFWQAFCQRNDIDERKLIAPDGSVQITQEHLSRQQYFQAHKEYDLWTTFQVETPEYQEARRQAFTDIQTLDQLLGAFSIGRDTDTRTQLNLSALSDFTFMLGFQPHAPELLAERQKTMTDFGVFLLSRSLTIVQSLSTTI